jgi:Rieske Fe-S protein
MDSNRRKFCQASGLVLASGLLPAGCLGNSEQFFHGGPASSVALNDSMEVPIPDHVTLICRDAGGLYAMSAYCTHAHCIVQFNPAMGSTPPNFICNCHMSQFDFNGQNQAPPAPSPLQHFKLVVDTTGEMFIDPLTIVDPKTRTPG